MLDLTALKMAHVSKPYKTLKIKELQKDYSLLN
jgi:hypothetical protein